MPAYTVEDLKSNPSIFDLTEGGPVVVEWKNVYGESSFGAILLIYGTGVGVLSDRKTNDEWRLTPADSGQDAIYQIPWEEVCALYTYSEYLKTNKVFMGLILCGNKYSHAVHSRDPTEGSQAQ